METRWRGIVIVDYEIGLPDHAVAELELYSQGLLRHHTLTAKDPLPPDLRDALALIK